MEEEKLEKSESDSNLERKKPIIKKRTLRIGRTTKKRRERRIKEEYAPENHFQFCTRPKEGTDPEIYCMSEQYINKYSFLSMSNSQKPQKIKKNKELPPPPTYMSYNEMSEITPMNIQIYLKDYELQKDGSMKFINKELQAINKKAMSDVFTRLAKSVFNSDIFGLSVPSIMHEPRSMTERMADYFKLTSVIMAKAYKITDPLERFKLCLVSLPTVCALSLASQMPFNPLLGETFQCCYEDGTELYVEQTEHHPAITNALVIGNDESYRLGTYSAGHANFTPNTMKMDIKGGSTTIFGDGHKLVCDTYPSMKYKGFMSGDLRLVYKGMTRMIDKTNGFVGCIFYDYGIKTGLFTGNKTVMKDSIEGIIYLPKEDAAPMKSKPHRISDLNNIKTELGRLSGSWMGSIYVNGVQYWSLDKIPLPKVYFAANPLPSDARFREDVIWLRRGKAEYSQSWKDAIEIRQRLDRKLREHYAKERKKMKIKK